MKLLKAVFLFLLIPFLLPAQTIEEVLKGSVKNPPVFHFNMILNRSIYLADMAHVTYRELENRIKEDKNFNRETWKNLQFTKIEAGDYSYSGSGKGYRFTFETQELYEQFLEYAQTENVARELQRYKEILMTGASPDRLKSYFNDRVEVIMRYYNAGNFRVAILGLNELIADYSSVYKSLDDLYFLRGEANFALRHYQAARADYHTVLKQYNGTSSFTNNAIYRLLFINYVYGQNETLLEDWEKLKGLVNSQNSVYYDIQMLLAVIYHQREDYQKVISTLSGVPREYPGYMMSNYVLGNTYAITDDVDNALRFYGRVERETVWPWDSKALKQLKTSAILQLGYLNYLKGVNMIKAGEFRVEETVGARKVTITPQTYFDTGKSYFDQVEKTHPEYSSAVLAETWIDLQQADYNTALLKVENYISQVTNQELLYQAVFLEGYIRQRKNPSQTENSESSYNYVINGMIAHQFLSDFYKNRNVINRQRVNMEVYAESRNLPQASLGPVNTLIESLDATSQKLGLSSRLEFRKDNRLLNDQILEDLTADIESLDKQKAIMRQRGLREMVTYADSAIAALKGIVDRAYAEPIGKDIVLFAQHAPILLRSSENASKDSYRMLRDVATLEVNRASDLETRVRSAVSSNKEPMKKDVISYMAEVIGDVKNRFNAVEVSFYEADFYRSQTEIERWGDASAFGLTSLLFSEFDRRKTENEENLKIRSALKRAISEKKDQFERYMSDLARIESQRLFVERIDSINSDFKTKLTDYRSVYFDPMSVQPIPKELMDRLNTPPPAPATKPEDDKSKKPDEKATKKSTSGKKGK